MSYLDMGGLAYLWRRIREALAGKQDKLSGKPGQVVGFNGQGEAQAQDAPGGKAGASSFEKLMTGRWP